MKKKKEYAKFSNIGINIELRDKIKSICKEKNIKIKDYISHVIKKELNIESLLIPKQTNKGYCKCGKPIGKYLRGICQDCTDKRNHDRYLSNIKKQTEKNKKKKLERKEFYNNLSDEIYYSGELFKKYDGRYYVSKSGKVLSITYISKKLLKNQKNKNGYNKVILSFGSDGILNKYIHHLVWETFMGEICDMTINHIDHNKDNNDLSNLELIPFQSNIDKYHEYIEENNIVIDYKGIKTYIQDIITNKIYVFDSRKKAADAIGKNPHDIVYYMNQNKIWKSKNNEKWPNKYIFSDETKNN